MYRVTHSPIDSSPYPWVANPVTTLSLRKSTLIQPEGMFLSIRKPRGQLVLFNLAFCAPKTAKFPPKALEEMSWSSVIRPSPIPSGLSHVSRTVAVEKQANSFIASGRGFGMMFSCSCYPSPNPNPSQHFS